VPIHFDSVSTPNRRRALLERWTNIPKDYMRLAIFDIVNLPDGIPHARLVELAGALKPHC
jgi:hypothetical protein